jgi:hypothetical protein
MSRLTKITAPVLREHALDVRAVEGVTGEARELVVTNPSFPHWGRVVIDRDGLLEGDHWGDINHDDGAAAPARVIVGILVGGDKPDPDRYGKLHPQQTRSPPAPPVTTARRGRTRPVVRAVRTFPTPSRAPRYACRRMPGPARRACGLSGPIRRASRTARRRRAPPGRREEKPHRFGDASSSLLIVPVTNAAPRGPTASLAIGYADS